MTKKKIYHKTAIFCYLFFLIIVGSQNTLMTMGLGIIVGDLAAAKNNFIYLSVLFLAFLLITSLLIFIGRIALSWSVEVFKLSMFDQLYTKLMTIPLNSFEAVHKGDTLNRFSNDIEQVCSFLCDDVVHIVSIILGIIASNYYLFSENTILGCVNLALGSTSLIFFAVIVKKINVVSNSEKRAEVQIDNFLMNMLKGKSVIEVFSLGKKIRTKNEFFLKMNYDLKIDLERKKAQFSVFNATIMTLSFIGMMIVGNYLIKHGVITVSIAISCLIISSGMVWMYRSLGELLVSLPEIKISLTRYQEILHWKSISEQKEEYDKKEVAVHIVNANEGIQLRNITVKNSSDKKILSNLNLSIKNNEIVGVKGRNGCGKTTLLKTLMGLYIPDSGSICANGKLFSDMDLSDWKEKFIYISQKPQIIKGTVYDNILFGSRKSKKDAEVAAFIANIDTVIQQLPKKYGTILDKDCLSSGEIQRLCLSRAFLEEEKILLLDEPTSSLDKENELKFVNALKGLINKRIIILVSHKESLFSLCDEVFDLEEINHNS